MSMYYDNHTLYVRTGSATYDQILEIFNKAIITYENNNNLTVSCQCRVNLLKNKEGESLGVAYVHISNPEIFHMILGKNSDGSERISYIDSAPPTQKEFTITDSTNWADWDDDDIVTTNKIPIQLEPLIVLPPYKLNNEQFNYLGVSRAYITDLESKYMPNILKCLHVPKWITKDDIKNKFIPYVSDSETLQDRTIKGKRFKETYPFVNINDNRVAFIIFDPSTNDARFALYMTKKLFFRKVLPKNNVMKTTLFFGHSYRTDRDKIVTKVKQSKEVTNVDTVVANNNRFHIFEKE